MLGRDASDGGHVELAWWLQNRLRGSGFDGLKGDQLASLLDEAREDGIDVPWLAVYRWAWGTPGLGHGTQFLAPSYAIEFVASLLAKRGCERILDPWSAGGLLAASVLACGGAHSAVSVVPQKIEALETLLPDMPTSELVLADPRDGLSSDLGVFDAVVCAPPMGLKPAARALRSEGPAVEPRGDPAVTVLVEASQHLAADGIGIALLPSKARRSLAEHAPKFGFHISAVLALAPKTVFAGTTVPVEAVAWSRLRSDSVFVGRLSSVGANDVLAENLEARRPGDAPELGRLVASDQDVSFERVIIAEALAENAEWLGAEVASVSGISVDIHLGARSADGGFVDVANSIYLPLIGESPVVTALADLRIKAQNYVQVVLDEERALAEYVAGWLNSDVGLQARHVAQSGFIPKLSKSSLPSVSIVLPPLESQGRSVAAHHRIQELDGKLARLREGLWENPAAADRIREELGPLGQASSREWIDSLPFPIASILRRYQVATTAEQKVEYLRRTFEATAQWTAVVLLSAFLSEPDYFLLHRERLIGPGYRAPMIGTFGSWLVLAERLAKRVRQMMSGKPEERAACLGLFAVDRPRLVEALTAKSLFGPLNVAKEYRGRWAAHGGACDEAEWKRRQVLFEAELGRLRTVLSDAFDDWELVQPGRFELESGVYTGDIERLTGSNVMFESQPVHLTAPMDRAHIYLLDLASEWSRPLRVVPLVRMSPVPRSEDRACYFYSRVLNQKDREILWISHHFTPKPEETTHDQSVLDLVSSLDTSTGDARPD